MQTMNEKDRQLFEAAIRQLEWDPQITSNDIGVTLPDDGIKATVHQVFATLEGAVEWNFQRTGAEACARNVPGVRGVMNDIVLKPKAVSTTGVSHKIEDALRRSAEVDAYRIFLIDIPNTLEAL